MNTVHVPFTRADYERLPVGLPVQLVEGWLVKEPAPTYGHQVYASRIYATLVQLVGPERVPITPVDVCLDDENVFQPDVVVLRTLPPMSAQYVGVPWIAVEVFSPSSEDRDRGVKKDRLLAAGVEEVWLIDPFARRIEVHRRDGVQTAEGDQTAVSRALLGFALVPTRLFAATGG